MCLSDYVLAAMIWLYPWLLLLLSVKNIWLEIQAFRSGRGKMERLSLYMFGGVVAGYFIMMWMSL